MPNARKAVAEGLQRAEENGYSNLLLTGILEKVGGDARERAFATALFYGTLERQYTLDYILQKHLTRPLEKLDAPVRAILRSGLYQLRYMTSVPAHAAVNEAVKLCRSMRKSSAAGLVNGVLRKAGAYEIGGGFESETQRLSVLYSVNESIARLATTQFGEGAEGLLEAFFARPPFTIRVNTLKTSREELFNILDAEGLAPVQGKLENSLRIENSGGFAKSEAFKSGHFHVQGEASQAAVLLLAPKEGECVLDLCSAPGGKALTIAQEMGGAGSLFCGEMQSARLELITAALIKGGVTFAENGGLCEAKQADAAAFNEDLCGADAVLCDVPCSGLGTMHKKPDIRMKDVDELRSLYELQTAILENAAKYPKIGGRLVYSTCTFNRLENEEIVKMFLARHGEYRLYDGQYPLASAGEDTGYGMLYTPRGNSGFDGFFMARLERVR